MSGAFQMCTCNGRRTGLGKERRADSNGLIVLLVLVARNVKRKSKFALCLHHDVV